MLDREIFITEDGSTSIFIGGLNEHYHSIHGAIQESMHVYIKNGLYLCKKNTLSILEIGFGTGLNALLTFLETGNKSFKIDYHSIEKYPLLPAEYCLLNFKNSLGEKYVETFLRMHECGWENEIKISSEFILKKIKADLNDWIPTKQYDLIYFDAFAPDKQPDLWTESMFRKMYDTLNNGGILTTYCAKGQVKRNMKAAGFIIESKPGPPGKREITVAKKEC